MMTDPKADFEAQLKRAGYSLTATRREVFAALQGKEPQTMRELLVTCEGTIDRASVYRTISLFEQLGIVKRLQIGFKYKLELSDAFHHHHHHLTCTICGRTTPFEESLELEQQLMALAASKQFAMHDHQLEIQGICKACQKT